MIDDLSGQARAFLENARAFQPKELRLNRDLIPLRAGVYGWWFKAPFLDHQLGGTFSRETHHLCYVGIAPNRPPGPQAKPRTLRDRLGDHLRGPIATSTLRRSLAALLADDLALTCNMTPSGKLQMGKEDEEKLTTWMADHALVTWLETPEPWLIEKELFKDGPRLPLNIIGIYNPFGQYLTALRGSLGPGYPKPEPYKNRFVGDASDIVMVGRCLKTVVITTFD